MKYLLDTCVISESARVGAEPAVLTWLASTEEEDLAISSLTLGEIEFGIRRLPAGRRRARLTSSLEAIGSRFADRTLAVDTRVARAWGELRARAAARAESRSLSSMR